MRWVENVACNGREERRIHGFVEKPDGKKTLKI
jgi:hypothetical protein